MATPATAGWRTSASPTPAAKLVDGILPEQLAYETAVLSVLAPEGQGDLAALLADLLSRLEGRMGALRA